MQITEKQELDEMLILDFVRCGIVRAYQCPHEWTINRAHHLLEPPSDPDGSISASLSYKTRCGYYSIWLRAALEELFLAMDKYNKTYKGYKNRNKYFNKAAKLAYKSFKRLAYCGVSGVMFNPLGAHSIRMRIVADMCDIERILRERCGFQGMLD